MKIEHFISMCHAPTEEQKKWYSENLDGQKTHFVNSGNLKDSNDEWVKKNVIFETDFDDNIANLNPHMSEMTTLYLIWKNFLEDIPDDHYIQLSHYRRLLPVRELDYNMGAYVSEAVPMIFNLNDGGGDRRMNILTGTAVCHPKEVWLLMEDAIGKTLTWRTSPMFQDWCGLPVMPAPRNLFAMKKPLLKEYLDWVFPKLLDEVEKKLPYDAPEYQNKYQQRAAGFVAERMFSWWIFSNRCLGKFNLQEMKPLFFENWKPFSDESEKTMEVI